LLFEPAALEDRIFTLEALQRKLRGITTGTPKEFQSLKQKKDIDRACPGWWLPWRSPRHSAIRRSN
jgi:hypothetical protein